jgi:CheY-like chemotaxis protein
MSVKINTVMLVDDEEIDQKTYQRVLKRSGIVGEILVFTYATDALEYLKSNPEQTVDVIFLDINMPRMNGFEFLEAATAELGEAFARMVIVMLTTSIDPKDRKRAEDNPLVRDFLDKPLTVEQVESVAAMLESGA